MTCPGDKARDELWTRPPHHGPAVGNLTPTGSPSLVLSYPCENLGMTVGVYTYLAFRFVPLGELIKLVFQPFAEVILNQDVEVLRQQTEDLRRTGDARFLYHETDAIARGIRDLIDGKSLAGRAPERRKLRV